MSAESFVPWVALLLLGAWHGINPGMGWLFAVALGLQEQSRRAVWRALAPLALGHGAAIAAALVLGLAAGLAVPLGHLKLVVAGMLLAFGVFRLVRARHPRWAHWGGMRVGARDLSVWSFLMASAHGAGLMVLPFVLGVTLSPGQAPPDPAADTGHHPPPALAMPAEATTRAAAMPPTPAPMDHGGHLHAAAATGLPRGPLAGLAMVLVHSAGYLLVMGLTAVVVYEYVGLRFLRRLWVNLDLIWGPALIATAALTPFL
jgi:hypothetical protein